MSSQLPQPEWKVPELRIMLIGKTGVGKTSALNVLLERPGLTKLSASSQTTECQTESRQFGGQKLVFIDTPGLMNTEKDQPTVVKDIVGCIASAAPGPHVFLLVLKAGRFSQQDKDTVEIIHQMFGKESKKHTLVLFTCGDEFVPSDRDVKKSFLNDYIADHHSFDNTGETRPHQVSELLDKINRLVEKNNGEPYTNKMLRKAQEVKEQQMEKFKGHDLEEPQVLHKVVEFISSEIGIEPFTGSMFTIVKKVVTLFHKYATQ